MRVECSSRMRAAHPIGSIFKVWAKVKSTDMDPHLYTSWQWDYEVLDESRAAAFITAKEWGIKRG